LAVRKDNTTGLEYKRSLTEEEQKARAVASINRIYSIASLMFLVGLFAVGALCVISVMNKAPTIAIVCEATVFVSLIALLVLISRARRRMNEQRVRSERYPYTSVDKKEIDKIFDLIADEEKKRERLNLFASSGTSDNNSSPVRDAAPVRSVPVTESVSEPEPVEDEPVVVPGDNTQDAASGQQEEKEMSSVLEEELNDVEIRMRAMAAEDEAEAEPILAREPAEEESEAEDNKEKKRSRPGDRKRPKDGDRSRQRPPGKRPPQGTKGKKRPEAGEGLRDPRDPRAQQGAKKRRPPPYDPYYGGAPYYYDEYGRPIRRPPPYDPYYGGAPYYYDEYGQPVRRREPPYNKERVYYDEYGRPIRRPPSAQDPRREDAPRRKRPGAPASAQPGGDPARRRPDGSKTAPGTAPEKKSKMPAAPIDPAKRTAAPVAMPSRKQDFDEEYVPVYIPYDEENDTINDAEHGAVPLRANSARKPSVPAAPPKPVAGDEDDYSPSDLEAVPIIVDDDYNPDYGDEETFAAPAYSGSGVHSGSASSSRYDYNVDEDDISPADMDAGVVVVHDFDDIDQDEYDARYSRDYNGSASSYSGSAANKQQNVAVEEESYSYEDEGVVVLPRDENYEEYMQKVREEEEKKRLEEEKQRVLERRRERRKNGKVTLTIRKVRRKKIHRNSRKYKRFRASVIPLIKYLGAADDNK